MKSLRLPAAFLAALVLLTACSTVDSRIKKDQAAFDALPAETQKKIREGRVEIGFTPQMVTMALGAPERRYTRSTESGTAEVWAYRDKGPTFGFGIGVGGGGGSTAVGGGVGVSTGGNREDDKLRVVIAGGKVTAIETIKR